MPTPPRGTQRAGDGVTSAKDTPATRATILVVDDNPHIAQILERHLTLAGFRVVTAGDGREALVRIHAAPPDCVLLDVMMPELSGLDVLRQLKAHPATASIPVVLVTAKAAEGDVEEGHRAGAASYVTKPFTAAHILGAVRSVLAAR